MLRYGNDSEELGSSGVDGDSVELGELVDGVSDSALLLGDSLEVEGVGAVLDTLDELLSLDDDKLDDEEAVGDELGVGSLLGGSTLGDDGKLSLLDGDSELDDREVLDEAEVELDGVELDEEPLDELDDELEELPLDEELLLELLDEGSLEDELELLLLDDGSLLEDELDDELLDELNEDELDELLDDCVDRTAQESSLNELADKQPPARRIVVGSRDLPSSADVFAATMTLSSAFAYKDGQVGILPDRIRSSVSAQSIVAGNVFQRRGEFWQISFDGETKFLKDSVGLGYITRLLVEPNRDIPAVTLLAARAGIDPLVASGSSGELLDDEARENYGRRYQELREDLEEAKENLDLGRVEKLETEMEQLTDELARATGIRGTRRQKYDADKVRRSVSEAVRRDVARIGKEHDALARHLTASISSGLTFRYAPEREIDWLT